MWLRDLRAKGYVEWIYSTHFAEKTKPAVYYLALNGIRFLRTLTVTNEGGEEGFAFPSEELRKRYKEPGRSQTFIERSLLVADCCLALERLRSQASHYYYQTEADYLQDNSYYHFLLESELIRPDIVFCKDRSGGEGKTLESYVLEIFDPTLPRYRVKKRLDNYVKFLDEEGGEWRNQTETEKLPIVLFVCPRMSDLIYTKRRTRGLVADAWEWEEDDTERPQIKFTTVEKLKQGNVLDRDIWEAA